MEDNNPCIGLFGTCDNVRWRDSFMAEYDRLGIAYFNPMVDNWTPGCIPVEKQHLEEDPIILFPVLSKSYGQGSLSELGFGPLRALRANTFRSFVILIDEFLDPSLTDEARGKDSIRSRKLVKAHLKGLNLHNVYLVENLEDMLFVSVRLYQAHKDLGMVRVNIA